MSPFHLVPLDRPDVPPRAISARLRGQLAYFTSATDVPQGPAPVPDAYTFDAEDIARWLDEGVFHLVSPLDSANQTEVELTEEQESFLLWLQEFGVRHARLVSGPEAAARDRA